MFRQDKASLDAAIARQVVHQQRGVCKNGALERVSAFHSLYTEIEQSRKQTDALTHARVRQDKL
jgi:hypothetical protein